MLNAACPFGVTRKERKRDGVGRPWPESITELMCWEVMRGNIKNRYKSNEIENLLLKSILRIKKKIAGWNRRPAAHNLSAVVLYVFKTNQT
jgi:hypothetical protein